MQALGRLLSWITNVTTVIAGLAITFMMLHISLDVITRSLFDYPIPGTMSVVSYYYMAIAAFIPLAFAEEKSAHISVEVLTDRLPAETRRHLAAWLLPLSAVVFALLTVRTWQEAMVKFQINASVVQGEDSLITWPTYFLLPLGCGLMFLIVLYKFITYVSGARSGLDETRALADDN